MNNISILHAYSYPTKEALDRAKANVVKSYLVVGLQEELTNTVLVLEHLLPEFFKGASQLFKWLQIGRFTKRSLV